MEKRKEKICCITGRRPDGFPFAYGQNEESARYKEKLRAVLRKLVEEEGVTRFITGGALGVDMDAAEGIMALQTTYPWLGHTLALPYEKQAGRYALKDKKRYETILHATEAVTLSPHYTPWCMQQRNEYMVDACDIVLAFVSGEKKGGTYNTVRYAKRKGKPVYLFALADSLTLRAEDWLLKAKNHTAEQMQIL